VVLTRITNFSFRHRTAVVVITVVLFSLVIAWNSTIDSQFNLATGDNLSSKSVKSDDALQKRFHSIEENVILIFAAKTGSIATLQPDGTYVDNPEIATVQEHILADIKNLPNYRESFSFWSLEGSERSNFLCCNQASPTRAIAFATVDDSNAVVYKEVRTIIRTNASPLVSVHFGGESALEPEFASTIENDVRGASIWIVLLFLVLMWMAFRSAIAVTISAFMIVFVNSAALLILAAIGHFTSVSAYVSLLIFVLGTCLSVYMSLLVTRAYRARSQQLKPVDAAESAILSVGEPIVISSTANLLVFLALLVFPQSFMRSFAICGAVTTLLVALFALFVLPVLLASAGPLDRFLFPDLKFIARWWSNFCGVVSKIIVPLGAVSLIILLAVQFPVREVHFGIGDQHSLDKDSPGRQAMQLFDEAPVGQKISVNVVFVNVPNARSKLSAVLRYKDALLRKDSVQAVVTPVGSYLRHSVPLSGAKSYLLKDSIRVQVVGVGDPLGYDAEQFVRDVQSVPAPFPALIGGTSARMTDSKANMKSRIPFAIGLLSLILFIAFLKIVGSWWRAFINVMLVALPLTATLGILTWIFQYGHFYFLNFTAGVIDYNNFVLVLCTALPLIVIAQIIQLHSMVPGEETRATIEKVGSSILIPAVLFSAIALPFAFVHVSFIKMFGLGLIIALSISAIMIRLLLAPALYRLFGASKTRIAA
jgi:RND superfamily putative drug exporter